MSRITLSQEFKDEFKKFSVEKAGEVKTNNRLRYIQQTNKDLKEANKIMIDVLMDFSCIASSSLKDEISKVIVALQ